MYPLAHIAIPAIIAFLFFLPALYAAIGGLLPDIFDKAIYALGLSPCGRFFGHTLFFGPLLALITFALTKNKKFAGAIWLGTYVHLLQDIPDGFVPWFYPVVNYNFVCPPLAFQPTAFGIAWEVIGLILIVAFVLFRWKFVAFRYRLWSWFNASDRRTKTKIRKKKK